MIRTKFIAVLLGPTGMGIADLLTSTTRLVQSMTNFGLETSAVKNIAEANSTRNTEKVVMIVSVFRTLVWITGLLGAFIVLIFAEPLSEIVFGNKEYYLAFTLLSIVLLLNQLMQGQLVLLKGMRKIVLLAKASLLGSLLGLLVSIPIYYIWGIEGIVPTIIITSVSSLLISSYFSRTIKIEKIYLRPSTIIKEGKGMLVMGFLIGLTGIMDQGVAMITKLYLSNYGNVDTVGLYKAGFAIVNTYVGLIFTAMMTDYYPRLSSVASDITETNREVNHQAEIALLILAPMVIFFMIFIDWIIIALYTERFLEIQTMLYWAMFGVLFKAMNWSIGIITLAKGDSKLYAGLYPLAIIIVVVTNIGGFYLYGLEGLGVAFFITHLLLTISGIYFSKRFYSFSLSNELIKVFLVVFSLTAICFLFVRYIDTEFNFLVYTVVIFGSLYYSYIELQERIDIKGIVSKYFSRK
jgi:O-antigen/teichoic acid export membrane protein